MTGLSILFNLKTEEACYVYGHMDAHRRANEQSIQQKYPDLLNPDRQRNYSDSRYTANSDLSRYSRPTSYNVTAPRYRSNYGYSDREPRSLYPELTESLYTNGGSMSKYTRGHDSNTNYDISGKHFESQRLYDRGKFDNPDVGAPKFEFGINYNAPSRDTTTKTGDTSSRSYDISTRDYDSRSPSYDVTTRTDDVTTRRSPARTSSLSDRSKTQAASAEAPYEPPSHQPQDRPRLNSAESSGSVASEKSDDRSLLNVLKNRYKENAERTQVNDPAARAPFSTWRRSGHYDDVTVSASHDGERDKSKPQPDRSSSLDRPREADGGLSKRDSYHEESRSHIKEDETTVESGTAPSPDDLLYNFRSALRRHHQLSEHDKEEQASKTAEGVSTSKQLDMEEKFERLRAARAKLQEQRSSSDKPRPHSFATEFRVKPEKVEKVEEDTKSQEIETKVETVTAPVEEPIKERQGSTKLSRQKLVSDDLKAKYTESRKDETSAENQEEALARKRSSRRNKHKEHMEYWSKDQDREKTPEAVESSKTDSVPTAEEMLLGTTRQMDRSPSSAAKKFQKVDHSSPFGAVYTKKPTQQPAPSPSQPPARSLDNEHSSAAAEVEVETVKQPEEPPKPVPKEPEPVVTDSKSQHPAKAEAKEKKSGRKLKKYTKSKSLELGVLGKPEAEVQPTKVEYKDDTKVGSNVDIDEESRMERINWYKDERKRQLAALSSKFDNAEKELPSLFLLGKAVDKDANVKRSSSMKVEMARNPDLAAGAVARSKSLKHHDRDQTPTNIDRDQTPTNIDTPDMPKSSGLKLAELGNQLQEEKVKQEPESKPTDQKQINTDRIIEKLHALKKLREQHLKGETGISIEELQNKRASKNLDDTSSIDSSVSYSSRTLLADKVVDDSSSVSSLNVPNRDRYRSSSSDRPRSRESSRESTPKIRSFSEKGESTYKSKFRTFSDRSGDDTPGKSKFEFGTVYKPREEKVSDRSRTPSEKDEESGRESVDLHSRMRRKLPSIEDVLGTSEDEAFDTPKRISPERETSRDSRDSSLSKQDSFKDEVAHLKADEIQRKKVLDNIERAKAKFSDDGQGIGIFGTKYDVPSKYPPKHVEKHRRTEKAHETVRKQQDEMDTAARNLTSMNVENTRQEMLGLKTNIKDEKVAKPDIKEERVPIVDPLETLGSVRKEMDPITGLYRVRQTGHRAKTSRTPSRETSEERASHRQEVAQAKMSLSLVKERSEERTLPEPEPVPATTLHPQVEEQSHTVEEDLKPASSPRPGRKLAIAEKFNKPSNESFQFGTVYSPKKEEPPPVKQSSQSAVSPEVPSQTMSSAATIVLSAQSSREDDSKPEPKSGMKITTTSSTAVKQNVAQVKRMSPVRTIKTTSKPEITPDIPVSALVYQPPPGSKDEREPPAKKTVSIPAYQPEAKEEPVSPFMYEPPAPAKVLGGTQTAQFVSYNPQVATAKQPEVKKEPHIAKPVSFAYEPSTPVKVQPDVKKEPQIAKTYEAPPPVKVQTEVKKEPQVAKPVVFGYGPQTPTKVQPEVKKEPQIATVLGQPAPAKVQPEVKKEPQIATVLGQPAPAKVQPEVKKEPQNATAFGEPAPIKVQPEVKKEPQIATVFGQPAPAKVQPKMKNEPQYVPVFGQPEPAKVQPKIKNEPQFVPVFGQSAPVKVQPVVKKEPQKSKPVSQPEVEKEPQVAKPVSFAYEPQDRTKAQVEMMKELEVAKPAPVAAYEPTEVQEAYREETHITKPTETKKDMGSKQELQFGKPFSYTSVLPPPKQVQAEVRKDPQMTEVIPTQVQKAEPDVSPAPVPSAQKVQPVSATAKVPSTQKVPPVSTPDVDSAAVKTSDESEKEQTVFNVQAGNKTELVVLKHVEPPEAKEVQSPTQYTDDVFEEARKNEEEVAVFNVQAGSKTELVVLKHVEPVEAKEVPSQTQYLEEVFEKAKEIEIRKSEEDLTKSESDQVDAEHNVRASLAAEHRARKRTEEEEEIAREKLARQQKEKEDKTVAFIKVQDDIIAKKKEMERKRGKKLERQRSAKGKLEKSVLTKVRVESQLQDATTLDDILDRNVEFLSDLEPPDFNKGGQGDKSGKSQDRRRVKRSLKKKSMKRSKSEDRSHFQIQDSDEDDAAARSRVTQDLRSTSIKLPRSRGDRAAANQKSVTSSDAIATSQKHGSSTAPQPIPGTSRVVSKNADGLEPVQRDSPVTQSAVSTLQAGPGSRLTTEISQVNQSRDRDAVAMATVIAPSVSVPQEAQGSTVTLTSSEQVGFGVGGMASDTSELLERRRRTRQSIDSSRDSETSKISDSDMSVSSALSEGSRKRRKDKTSLRKSRLNESSDDAPLPRRRDSTESSRTSRTSVRRVASSRLAREPPPPDKTVQKDEDLNVLKTHDIEISVVNKNFRVPDATQDGQGSGDKPLSNSDLKHVNNTDTTRVAHKSVLDSHSVLPSRFALPSKVSSAISRLSEASEKSSRDSSPLYKKTDQIVNSSRGIRRENNFNKLLQKFSGSEASSSEKSDTERSPRTRKVLLKRQGAYTASTSSSDEVRRTPERTQSLRLRSAASPASDRDSSGSSVQRSASFKSDFMKRRFSPDPENRRRLPDTPSEQSDKPSPELASVLSKRNNIVKKQQEEGEVLERKKIHDGTIEKAEHFQVADSEEVIADSEVLQMLRSRRRETDSSVSESEETPQKPAPVTSVPQLSPTVIPAKQTDAVQVTPKQVQRPKEVRKPSEESKSEKQQRLSSQSSFESKTAITLSSPPVNKLVEQPLTLPQVKEVPKPVKAESMTVTPKLDLTAIDTSLEVLNKVTASVDDTDKPSEKESKLEQALSHVDVTSETDVVQFIKTVESVVKTPQKVEEKIAPAPVKPVQSSLQQSAVKEEEEFRKAGSPSSPGAGTIDISSKSEIKKKFSREITPERQSPLRSVPMKVPPPMKATVGLSRTESMGRSESERPKGILKRTPSLKQTGVHVDPELAEVLKLRRNKQSDDEDQDQKKLTVEEEIQQQRELQAKKDEGKEREVSVAERVFQMHNKIEEIRSCPITPRRLGSGIGTPKAYLHLSGPGTPGNQYSFDETGSQHPQQAILSGTQLIERLATLEGEQGYVSEKRKRFQQTRKKEDWRTRTQPVTLHEIQQADNLETVRKFRTEVIQKAEVGLFDEIEKQEEKEANHKTEFPHHVKHEHNRHHRGDRHKTLPITAAELNAIPEGQISGTTNTLKKQFETIGARDSKGDSGILSGSDGDNLSRDSDSYRSLSMEEKIDENDPVKMSVSAKASMFLQIQESLKERQDKKSASGAKRYIDRKKRERSRTLPITEDECKLAAEMADKEEEEAKREAEKTTATTEAEQPAETTEETDELSRQSLKDKVKLFASIEEEKKVAAQKKGPAPPPPKRRNRKFASRFATQPVTYEEVEKAAKISPLACSLVKPPDPDILSGLSVKAQRELIAQHAEKALSQPGSRTGSRPTSRSTSVTDLSVGVVLNKDALTATNTEVNENIGGWEPSDRVRPSDLKGKTFTAIKQEETKIQTVEKITTNLDSNRKSILKSELEQKLSLGLQHDTKGILKAHSDAAPTLSDIKSILKKETSVETSKTSTEVKSILKKESSFETRKVDSDKSAMKAGDTTQSSEDAADTSDTLESDTKEPEGVESSGDNLDSDEGILDAEDKTSAISPRPHMKSKDRRRFNRDRKLEAERYKTQPAEPATEDTSRPKKKYVSRHLTQPITPDEKKEAEVATATPEVKKSGSINDRLNALKKSGEEGWRKRVSHPDDLDRCSLSPPSTPPNVKMRDKKNVDTPRPSSIADRLSLLDSAQGGWRDRIGETDVKKFTIEHKISSSGQPVGESPLVTRLKGRGLRKELSRGDSESSENSDLPSPSSPTKESSKIPMPREVVCTDLPPELLKEDTKSPLTTIKSEEEEAKAPVQVEVPDIDAEMESFFVKKEVLEKTAEEIEVSVDDFNELFINANDILETTRRIKPKRRQNPSSRNPMKTMSACLEVKTEYTEVLTGVAEREVKRQKTAQLSQNSGFAVEALAGLASKENFAKVELRKTDSTGASRLDPYLPLMLIHIKGRRKVQCRLVEPSATSLNSGDCFVLITPDRNMQWCGDYSNVIEKAKVADFCDQVKQKRDMGCKAREINILEEKNCRHGVGKHFWDLIGGHKDYLACGPPEEDELYENHILETNMIYKMEDNKLVPVEDCWGAQPKYKMLQSSQVYVFDFGSEVYLWQGKSVSPNQRKISVKLAEQVWNKGYDYSQCDINPLSPLKTEEEGGLPSVSAERPDWALFGKVNQNMETILFREKFADWPDTSRMIKVKSQDDVNPAKVDLADLKAFDASLMVPVNTNPVTMVLDGANVGRGVKWELDMDGFIQTQLVETLKVRVWHVLEYDHYEIEPHSFGQFHEGDTYVIRWQYMIVNAGMKSLRGNASKHGQKGRERCAYFFWQGSESTINEKGASALMTVELDEERGPQVRVDEGKEPPCFLNLFKGRMMIHIGKREEEETNTVGPWKFYCLRNEYENEICLIEVPRDLANVRSVSSFLLLNVKTGKLMVWHGCKSPEHTKKLATTAAGFLKERCPMEVGLHKGKEIDVTEVKEGDEGLDFWRVVNETRNNRTAYNSLLKNPESFTHTLRLFHMTSVSGVFEAAEVVNPSRAPDLPTRFPVLQTDLYKASQPALFLIDNGHEVYLWQGWLPEEDENQQNVLTGSAVTRLATERKCALETTIHYCKEINPDSPPPAYLVYAGLEPLSFTNLFPIWNVDENVKEINLKEGKEDGEMIPVEELLAKVSKTRYTLAELLEIPPPEGVDPLKLESYLSDEEFEAVLDMNRDEFYALPNWKQSKFKQQAGLY